MKRRHFLRAAAVAGAAGAVHARWAMADVTNPSIDRLLPRTTTPIIDGLNPSELNETYLQMLKQVGVSGMHKSMGDVQSFADVYNFLDGRNDAFVATTARDLREADQQGTVGILFGWQSADPLGTVSNRNTTPLRGFYQMGLRVVNLVYNVMNQFAGGCLEPDKGLTGTGRRLVEEIHNLKMMLDVGGHTGEQSSLEAVALSTGVPVICSHTNMGGLIDNPRNISDRLAEAIAGTGGVIGLTAINDFNARNRRDAHVKVTPQAPISALLNQYDYLKKLVGVDHIGMGNDFTEGRNTRIDPDLPQFGREMASEQQPIFYVKGFETITELPNLIGGLKERGWTDEEIDKVMGGNWLRIYERVFGG